MAKKPITKARKTVEKERILTTKIPLIETAIVSTDFSASRIIENQQEEIIKYLRIRGNQYVAETGANLTQTTVPNFIAWLESKS